MIPSPVSAAPPIEECWAVVDGLRMRYLRSGTGPALVLLHGLLGYSFSWRFALPAMAPYATVYAVDMPGTGFSQRSPSLDCGFRTSARRLLQFAEQLGLDSFDLLGTSHGGAVAIMATALAQEMGRPRVKRLVLAAPVNPWSPHGAGLARFLSGRIASHLFRQVASRLTMTHSYWLRRLYGDPRRVPPGTLEGYARALSIPGSWDYGLKVLATWNEDLKELEATLPRMSDVPTLLVWGDRDAAVSPSSAQSLRRQLSNCRLVIFDGVGHLPYEETPELFNREVIAFLGTLTQ